MRSESPVLETAVIRDLDRRAVEERRIPSLLLMENAGQEAARRLLLSLLEEGCSAAHVVVGPGNNGGDGLVVARHLASRGFTVRATLTFAAEDQPQDSDPMVNLRAARGCGVPITESLEPPASLGTPGEVIVDALLGTGIRGEVRGHARSWIEAIRASALPTYALDLPSGLDADRGEVLGVAVRARETYSFGALKPGFARNEGPAHTGKVHWVPISWPLDLVEEALRDARKGSGA